MEQQDAKDVKKRFTPSEQPVFSRGEDFPEMIAPLPPRPPADSKREATEEFLLQLLLANSPRLRKNYDPLKVFVDTLKSLQTSKGSEAESVIEQIREFLINSVVKEKGREDVLHSFISGWKVFTHDKDAKLFEDLIKAIYLSEKYALLNVMVKSYNWSLAQLASLIATFQREGSTDSPWLERPWLISMLSRAFGEIAPYVVPLVMSLQQSPFSITLAQLSEFYQTVKKGESFIAWAIVNDGQLLADILRHPELTAGLQRSKDPGHSLPMICMISSSRNKWENFELLLSHCFYLDVNLPDWINLIKEKHIDAVLSELEQYEKRYAKQIESKPKDTLLRSHLHLLQSEFLALLGANVVVDPTSRIDFYKRSIAAYQEALHNFAKIPESHHGKIEYIRLADAITNLPCQNFLVMTYLKFKEKNMKAGMKLYRELVPEGLLLEFDKRVADVLDGINPLSGPLGHSSATPSTVKHEMKYERGPERVQHYIPRDSPIVRVSEKDKKEQKESHDDSTLSQDQQLQKTGMG